MGAVAGSVTLIIFLYLYITIGIERTNGLIWHKHLCWVWDQYYKIAFLIPIYIFSICA